MKNWSVQMKQDPEAGLGCSESEPQISSYSMAQTFDRRIGDCGM